MADNETTTDIIAWLRKPREGENAYLTLWRDEIADRLGAAQRRERGDCAKLREALVKCREIALQWQADEAAGVAGTTDKPHARSAAEAVVDMEFEINAALSAPPRNCDVGTAQEQDERFHRFCVKHHTGSCAGCHNPVGDYTVANGVRECALVWAQMPYEEGGAR